MGRARNDLQKSNRERVPIRNGSCYAQEVENRGAALPSASSWSYHFPVIQGLGSLPSEPLASELCYFCIHISKMVPCILPLDIHRASESLPWTSANLAVEKSNIVMATLARSSSRTMVSASLLPSRSCASEWPNPNDILNLEKSEK